jgi:hypothetical protein
MKNNRLKLVRSNGGSVNDLRARNRVIRLYNALQQKGVKGGWRAVAKERGSKNQSYIYNFAMKGIKPSNHAERVACYLEKEKKPRISKMKRLFDMSPIELLWRLNNREVV